MLFTAIIAYFIDGLGTRLMSCIIKWYEKKLRKQVNKNILYEKVGGI